MSWVEAFGAKHLTRRHDETLITCVIFTDSNTENMECVLSCLCICHLCFLDGYETQKKSSYLRCQLFDFVRLFNILHV